MVGGQEGGREHEILRGELLPLKIWGVAQGFWGGALGFGGELKGEHFFAEILSAPPHPGGGAQGGAKWCQPEILRNLQNCQHDSHIN